MTSESDTGRSDHGGIRDSTRRGAAGDSTRPEPCRGLRTSVQTTSDIDTLYAGKQHTVADIAKLLGVSRQTVYRALEPETVAK